MTIERVEVFALEHTFLPRRGVSIALWNDRSYILVKLTDTDGVVGWGETYLGAGTVATAEAVGAGLIGRSASDALALKSEANGAAQDAYVWSAFSIAIDDLRARQAGIPVHELYGGARRSRIRAYAASGGYVEGEDPAVTWPREMAQVLEAGFTAWKLRIGRFPLAHEGPIYRRLRAELPPEVDLMADGNGGYTFRQAIATGNVLGELGFLWWEEPLRQWDGYVGYERLAAALDIALAGGEITMSRGAARDLIDRAGVDIIQPDPVICGGISETLFIADLARLNAITCAPHTSGSAIGIAAAIQVIAALPDPTRLPLHDVPILEYGVDPNPWRTDLLAEPLQFRNGWVDIPTGPGLGVQVNEAHVRRVASDIRVVTAR